MSHQGGKSVAEILSHQGAIIAVNKPLGWTSFDVVNKLRYKLSRRLGVKKVRVGHAGTLDPLATGVVVICIGRATKQIEALQTTEKRYTSQIMLGATTPSYDLETPIDQVRDIDHVTLSLLEATLGQFVGEIEQVPPIFSACKVDGKRAYDLARQGAEVKLEAKKVHIYSIELLEYTPPLLSLSISCGKGTYIRSLARDLGEALGCGAHLVSLRRDSVGPYDLTEAITPEEMEPWVERLYSDLSEKETMSDSMRVEDSVSSKKRKESLTNEV